MNIALWIVQALLALAFLVAGYSKALRPLASLKKTMSWVVEVPAALVRFIGVAEILGAIGLILPAATGVAPMLTVAAAVGLALVMVSALIFHVSRGEYSRIGMNLVLLLLTVFVVVGRLAWAPL